MSVWKAILRVLGLSDDARIRISAPGIEVVITGEPEKVRSLLAVVRAELEKDPRLIARGRGGARGRRRTQHPAPASDSQVVRPTELDEMDSPYALPEAVVMPVPDDEVTAERLVRRPSSLAEHPKEADTLEPDTVLPRSFDRVPSEETVSALDTQSSLPAVPVDDLDDGEPEAEATAVAPSPSGTLPASRRPGFVTDGGPTLMPSDSQNELRPSSGSDRSDTKP